MARKRKAKPIFTADCETDPFEKGRIPVPFLWGLYDGNNYNEFEKTSDFIRYISEIDCIVYAHNGGKFDWHFITDYIEHGTDLIVINGRLAKFKIGNAEFRDSWNILPVPLGAMEKTKIDYSIFEVDERYKPHNYKLIRDYLYDDCRFLWDYVQGFIEKYGRHLTLATASLKTWEVMTGNIAPHDFDGDIYDKFSRYYYGGRCEVFQHGEIKDNFAMVDIKSAYPRAMLEDHPFSLEYETLSADELEDMRDDMPGHVFCTVTGPSVGALPYRSIKDSSLHFPADGVVRTFHITGWEFNALRDTRGADNYFFIEGFEFIDTVNFSDFILPLYEERARCADMGDKKGNLLAKLIMNSLYGKFAANPRNYSKFKAADPVKVGEHLKRGNAVNHEWEFAGYFGELALLSKPLPEYEERFYNVATSASITGYVRAFLWRSLCQCEGLLYCDTDSIAARDVSRLSTSDELGAWSIEGAFKRGGIGGKKLYAFEGYNGKWKTASKGAKIQADDIMQIACQNKPFLYEPIAPSFSVHNQPRFVNREIKRTKKVLVD